MRLCFGSYLAVLVSCKAVNVDNKELCEALLHSVAPNFEFIYNGQENADRVREDNSSKLLRCENNLPPDVVRAARSTNAETVSAYFRDSVARLIDESRRKHIILALKDIISNDPPVHVGKKVQGIDADTKIDLVSGTTKKTLAEQNEFCFHRFLAGVFLFIAAYTNNRSGKSSVKDVNDDYLLTFAGRAAEIKLLEDEGAKKAVLLTAAKQGNYDTEFAEDVADRVAGSLGKLIPVGNADTDLLITLLTEARGKCLHCGKELGIPLRRKKATSNCKIMYLTFAANEAKNYENAVALCATTCAEEVSLMSDDEKRSLLEDKRRRADVQAFLGRISNVVRSRREIEAVLREIHDIKNNPELPKAKPKELVEIKQKIHEPNLMVEIDASMVRMYKTVKNICGRLEGEGSFDTEIFGDMMKAAQAVLSSEVKERTEITDPQEYVTQLLVERLFSQVGQKHLDACKIIVGYLVKRCDLFNEAAKQS